jgi:hypothetical protein
MVIYRNYSFIDIQIRALQKAYSSESLWRLLIVDNTPDNEKKHIKVTNRNVTVLPLASQVVFDGLSHGRAIDFGLLHSSSDYVCILDSDCFLVHQDMTHYISKLIDRGFVAFGAEYNDGEHTHTWVNLAPERFKDIPCCFFGYYRADIAKSGTWVVTEREVVAGRLTGYIEVGWRIRRFLFENNCKTLSWKTQSSKYGDCFFEDESGNRFCVHVGAASHRRMGEIDSNHVIELLEF